MKPVFLVACVVFVAGCAMRAPESRPPAALQPDQKEVQRNLRAISQIESELDDSLQAEQAPNCTRVCTLLGNICRLADKICVISKRHPDSSELSSNCREGHRSCGKALARVKPRCRCGESVPAGQPG